MELKTMAADFRGTETETKATIVKLSDDARALIGSGAEATLVTLNPDGSPQATLVWAALQSTPEGDELVAPHMGEYQKVRNIRRDGRVTVIIVSRDRSRPMTPYLAITGIARIVDGGAPELLAELARSLIGPDTKYPPMDNPPPGFVTRVRIEKVGGVGPWAR